MLQAVDDDMQDWSTFYAHYRRDRGVLALMWRGEWALRQTGAFPSARGEIGEGIDCFGLEHYAAEIVFHMMRVAEIGMRALARERKAIASEVSS